MSSRGSSERPGKAEREELLKRARSDTLLLEDGLVVGTVCAAEERARLLRAHRLHEARLLRAEDDEVVNVIGDESLEAEAGAILEAEAQVDLHRLRVIADAWLEANKG